MKKILVFILSVTLIMFSLMPVTHASCTVTVSSSAGEVNTGDSVSVTFTFKSGSSIGSADTTFNFDSTKLKYSSYSSSLGNSNVNVAGETIKISDYSVNSTSTYTVKLSFTATAVGNANVQLILSDVGDSDGISIGSPTGGTAISVKAKNLSSNANLSSLTLPEGCVLTPKFSPGVTEYTCTAPHSLEKFPLDWKLADSSASARALGSINLTDGENTRKVQVTASDGTVKTYTIKIIRTASEDPVATPLPSEEIKISANGKSYILEQTVTIPAPEGYSIETIDFDDKQTQAMLLGNIVLLQLTGDNDSSLFIYDAETQQFTPFRTVKSESATYTYLGVPENLSFTTEEAKFTIGDDEYDGLTSPVFGSGYYIIKCMNNANGEVTFCVFCQDDMSVQKLSSELSAPVLAAAAEAEEIQAQNFFIDNWQYFVIGALAVALIVFVILFLRTRPPKKPKTPKKKTNGHNWDGEAETDNEDHFSLLDGEEEPEEIIFNEFE